MTTPHKNSTAGFTLLEVMIAMVIFSIGLLGLAGLQGAGLRNNQTSFSRTIATQLAYDMADRIRNNRNANYATASGTATNCMGGANCGQSQIANFDVYEWRAALTDKRNGLLNGRGFITRSTASGMTIYTVSVAWDENRANLVPTSCTAPAGISCVSVEVTP